jgi:hypothetical protein
VRLSTRLVCTLIWTRMVIRLGCAGFERKERWDEERDNSKSSWSYYEGIHW